MDRGRQRSHLGRSIPGRPVPAPPSPVRIVKQTERHVPALGTCLSIKSYAEPGPASGKDDIQMNLLRQESPDDRVPVEGDYQAKLTDLNQKLSFVQWRQSRALVFLLGSTLLLILSLAWNGHFRFSLFASIPTIGLAVFVYDYVNCRKAALRIALRCGFYERGVERLRLNWEALFRTGKEFARASHLYQFDLQILGERSLFSLLCTTRSEAGAARLAEYLLQPADLDEVIARQCAVREL